MRLYQTTALNLNWINFENNNFPIPFSRARMNAFQTGLRRVFAVWVVLWRVRSECSEAPVGRCSSMNAGRFDTIQNTQNTQHRETIIVLISTTVFCRPHKFNLIKNSYIVSFPFQSFFFFCPLFTVSSFEQSRNIFLLAYAIEVTDMSGLWWWAAAFWLPTTRQSHIAKMQATTTTNIYEM